MNLDRIRVSNLKFKNGKYVAQCSLCDNQIVGFDPEEVVAKARARGWRYDRDNDLVLCPLCLDEYVEDHLL